MLVVNMKKKLLIVLAMIVLLMGCSNAPIENVVAGIKEPRTFSFGGPKNINMLPIIADRMHFFDKYNLNMQRQDIQTGKMAMDALLRGDIDFATIVETNIAFAGFQNPDIEVIGIIEEKTDDALIVQENIKKPSDLIGKKIGATKGTTSEAFLIDFLKSNDVEVSKVEIINMPQPSIQAAMANNNLDAGSMWQPFRYNVKGLEELSGKRNYKAYALIAVRKEFAEKNPIVVKNFLRALIEAERYYNENQQQARNIFSEELAIPIGVLNDVWDDYRLEVSMKKELLDAIKTEGRWIIELEEGFSGKDLPNYSRFVDKSIIEKIDETRVKW